MISQLGNVIMAEAQSADWSDRVVLEMLFEFVSEERLDLKVLNYFATARLCKLVNNLDGIEEFFDETIIDCVNTRAAAINNGGVGDQIEFLVDYMGIEAAERFVNERIERFNK